MNLLKAFSTGKNFKRPCHAGWLKHFENKESIYALSANDLIADDWFIEEEKIEITRSEFFDSINFTFNKVMGKRGIALDGHTTFQDMLFELLLQYWKDLKKE